jgi:hypothetical protein
MNPKQLANVLIKILGLSLCAHSITSVFVVILSGLQISTIGHQTWPREFFPYLVSLTISVLPFTIGVFFIVQSRWMTDKLFKDEAE